MTLTDGAGATVAVGADLLLAGPVYADLGGNVALVRTAKGDLVPIATSSSLARASVALASDLAALDSAVASILLTLASVQPLDATLTALAALNSTAGLLEQTGADAFSKRALGVGASTSIPTRADADARFAAIVHDHVIGDVTDLESSLDAISFALTGKAATSHTHGAGDVTSGTLAAARLPTATTTTQGAVELATSGENAANVVVQGNDSRLSDARAPTAHATSHKHGGSDEVATATAAANAIPKAGAGATLSAGWLPALSGAITTTAGSATTAFGVFKANALLMNMTNASGVPTAVDGTDAAANLWAFFGGSYLLVAWDLANAKLGSIAI